MTSPPAATTSPALARPVMLWWPLLACAAAAVVWLAIAVAVRLPYPHELEWMEGALADNAARVANGLPIYCVPGPEHVPFLYAPMLFWLGGALIAIGVDGLLALRLIAVLSTLGCALLIGHWVRRECGRIAPGLVASGIFVAGYGWLAWWYDLARNDSLFVLAVLATAYVLRRGGARRWAWSGLLAAAAVLCKQSALMWLPAIAVGTACVDWRVAVRFVATAAIATGGEVLVLHLCSDGWSTFFLFEMPRHHAIAGASKLGYWTSDLRPMLPLVALGVCGFVAQWRTGARRDALFFAAFGSGALVTSWLSRMHVGGFDNVLMYGFAGACVLGPIAAANARWLAVAGPIVLLAQFGWLAHRAWHRGTQTLFPPPAHRRAYDELIAFVRAQPGPVWLPAHGGIAGPAGKALGGGTGAHGQAIFDLLQLLPKLPDGMLDLSALQDRERLAYLSPRAQQAIAALLDGTATALREHRYAAIVVDDTGGHAFNAVFAAALAGADGKPGTDDDPYVRTPGTLLTEPTAIAPLVGYWVHSPYALVPRR